MESLSQFFDRVDPAKLAECDREPLHQIGAIQEHGVLLALDHTATRIIAASRNAGSILGLDLPTLFRSPAKGTIPDLHAALSAALPLTPGLHTALDLEFAREGRSFDAVAHAFEDGTLIELLPAPQQSAQDLRRQLREISLANAKILHAPTWQEALDETVDAIRVRTGFRRVKIYRFLPDWSGEVVAESNDGTMPSYLGLRFPATDIPKQAREMYRLTPARGVGNVHDRVEPIVAPDGVRADVDLTYSLLRAVSPIHTHYLRNMGVEATYSMRLMDGQRLWGIVACHHDAPRWIPFDDWGRIRELTMMLMLCLERQTKAETTQRLIELQKIEALFRDRVREQGSVMAVITEFGPMLQGYLNADGFALQYGDRLLCTGATPPESVVHELIRWAGDQEEPELGYSSNRLHEVWPPAAEHVETACGVLIQPVVTQRPCQLLWFRGPITKRVRWAGEPEDKSGDLSLTPRNSFATWVQERRDQSAEWERSELESAREVLSGVLDIVISRFLLEEENQDLRQFASVAAHDLQAPLRRIRTALSFLREDGLDEESLMQHIGTAESSAETLDALTDGLTRLMLAREREPERCVVELDRVVDDALDLISHDVELRNARIERAPLPQVVGNHELLTHVVLNLVANALKYAGEQTPTIRILPHEEEHAAGFAVEDRGSGIPDEAAERVFVPLTRLVRADQVQGSGLGLAICRKILDSLGGAIRLDLDYTDGARFVCSLPRAEG